MSIAVSGKTSGSIFRARLLSGTCFSALAVLGTADMALAQSVIIDDARIVPQNLDTLLPPASPKTAAVTSTGSVIVTDNFGPAVAADTSGWTLGNGGTIVNRALNALSYGIGFDQGGTITNSATGHVAGVYGIVIEGEAGVVTNSGTITGLTDGSITGGGLRGIDLRAGGTVTNNAGGLITAFGGGIFIDGGGAVSNSGSIVSSGFNGVRIEDGGTIVNNEGGYIEGGAAAASVVNGGTITNAGTMVGTGGSDAVLVNGGGLIVNTATGVMSSNASSQTVSTASGIGTIDNAGTIVNTNTTANFATGAAIYTAGSTIVNRSTGYISARANGVFANNADATIINDGRIESSTMAAVEFNAGGIFVNTGTVTGLGSNAALRMAGNTTATGGTITNSGTIGTTSGATAIELSNASHVLNLDTGSVINGNVLAGGGAGIDEWNLLGSGSEVLDKFQDFEIFRMQGSEWTLTGTGSIASWSRIDTGILRVNGTLTTPTLEVLAAGTLAGNGTIIGDVTNDAGRLAPGDQTTVLTIQGNLTMGADSIYLVDVDPTSATRTNVVGAGATATLEGGQVQVNVQSGTFLSNTEYLILHAEGGIVGGFDPELPQQGNFRFSLRQDENDIWLTLLRFAFNDPGICDTRNQCAVGTGLEAVAENATSDLLFVINTLGGLDVPGQQRGLAAMAGDHHATLAKLALEGNALFGQSVSRRLAEWRSGDAQTVWRDDNAPGTNVASAAIRDESAVAQLRQGPARADGFGVWMRGYGVFGSLDGDGNAAGVNYDIGGAAIGIDRQFSDNFIAGLSFGYANTKARFGREGARASIDSYDVGLYAGFHSGGFRADAVLSYAYLDNSTSRSIPLGPIDRKAKADYGGHRFGAGLDLGYTLRLGPIEVEPQAGLQYTRLRQNAFTEKGAGAINLDVEATKVESLRGSLGLRLATSIGLGGGAVLVPELRGRWHHEFLDSRGRIDASFAGQPASNFTADGVKTPDDSAVIGGGLMVRFSPTLAAFVDYDAKLNRRETVHNVTGGLRLTW